VGGGIKSLDVLKNFLEDYGKGMEGKFYCPSRFSEKSDFAHILGGGSQTTTTYGGGNSHPQESLTNMKEKNCSYL